MGVHRFSSARIVWLVVLALAALGFMGLSAWQIVAHGDWFAALATFACGGFVVGACMPDS